MIPIGYLLLASVPLVVTDIREHRLPNRFTYPAILLAFVGTGFAALSQGAYLGLISAHLSSTATFGIGYLLAKYAGVGMGDVKLITATNHLLAWFFALARSICTDRQLCPSQSRQLVRATCKEDLLAIPGCHGPLLACGFLHVCWAARGRIYCGGLVIGRTSSASSSCSIVSFSPST